MKNKSLLGIVLTITVITLVVFLRIGKTESNSSNNSTSAGGEQCIITIDGAKYDVTTYRNQHEGGDVFVCGSDMSEAFHNQHPDSFLKKISRYKVI